MRSPTSAQMASSTHWPSWSQAPFWCGSPKSPTTIGPSTALDDLGQRDLLRWSGEHVAAAHAPLGAHEAGALEGQEDLLEVRLGEARALRDVAHRRGRGAGVQGEREQRPARVVPTGRHLHRTPTSSRHGGHRTGPTSRLPVRGGYGGCAGRRAAREGCGKGRAWGIIRSSPTTAGRASRTWSRRCSSRERKRLPGSPRPRSRPTRCVLLVLDGLGWDQLAGPARAGPDALRHGRRADRQRRPVHHRHRPHVDRHRASRRASTAWSATGSRSTARCSTSCAGRPRRATPAGASTPTSSSPTRRSAASGRRS